MKFPSLPCNSLCVLLATAFTFTSISSQAETRCPGNIAGLKPRMVAGALLVIPVRINQSGPFDFMVDTGSQLNLIDPSLAAQLNLKSQGTVGLVATAAYSQASVGVLDSLQVGSETVLKPFIVIQDLGPIQAADPRIRGVLGENFLAHFDVLIDYSRGLLCLDDAKLIEKYVRGERIPLVTSRHPESEVPFSERLVVSVNLSDTGTRPILLQIDSGSDGPILFAGDRELVQPLLKRAKLQGPEVSDARRAFAVLPPQDMRLGNRIVRKVPFVTPAGGSQNGPDREENGILPTVLFQRVYVCHSDRFVIFDPR
jgi:Aspartyl protease